MPETITKPGALKEFFGCKQGQTTADFLKELTNFKKEGPAGYDWCAAEAAKALGKTLA